MTKTAAPWWMRTLLRLWPGGRGKRDAYRVSDETLRGYYDKGIEPPPPPPETISNATLRRYLKQRDARKDGSP